MRVEGLVSLEREARPADFAFRFRKQLIVFKGKREMEVE